MKILNEKLFLSGMLVLAMACNSNADRDDSVDSANDMNDKKDTSGVLAPSADTMATMPVDMGCSRLCSGSRQWWYDGS